MGAVDTEETRRVTGAAASEALPEVAGPALAPVAAVVPALAAGADTDGRGEDILAVAATTDGDRTTGAPGLPRISMGTGVVLWRPLWCQRGKG